MERMPEGPRILAFAGSLRKGSFNRMLLRYATLGAREAGAEVEELGPEHLMLPLYDGDLEANGSFPEPVAAWRAKIRQCEGLLIASRSEEHTSELQSPCNLVCRLLLEKKECIIACAAVADTTSHC